MFNTDIIELPRYLDSSTVFNKISPLGHCVCLSGAWGQNNTSKTYDIFSAAPTEIIRQNDNTIYIKDTLNQTQTTISCFEWLEIYFAKNKEAYPNRIPSKNPKQLPLIFGFIGYASYDYGRQIEAIPSLTINDPHLPIFCGGIYLWNLINDKQNKTTFLSFALQCPPELKSTVLEIFSIHKENKPDNNLEFKLTSEFQQATSHKQYQDSLKRISDYIKAGDCYQINFSHRHKSHYKGKPSQAYTLLNDKINTPYSAYLDFDDHQILSLSPERFIKVQGNNIETKPIKGTIQRGITQKDDVLLVNQLKNSTKDRAENLMIVDLLRNDLNKTCKPGTVKVPKLFDVETFPNVHHLVSTVTGEKTIKTSALEVLRNAFPGGSIIGAPKIRAMEIIEELESHRRSIYCGSIFYMTFDGDMDSNICIRTLLCKNDTIYCWGGGGIVADSNCDDEYEESITKVKNLMDILEGASNLK